MILNLWLWLKPLRVIGGIRIKSIGASSTLIEGGTDLRYIKELLRHAHSKTTEIYTHVSAKSLGKIKSPSDSLALGKEVASNEN